MAVRRRIRRDFRQLTPAKFLSLNQRVKRSLMNNQYYPESMWEGSDGLLQRYFRKVDELEVSYHLASDGSRSLIREREKLTEEIIDLLDEIASLLEAASISNPDALLTTGFTVSQERKSPNRVRPPLQAPIDFTVINMADPRKAKASTSPIPGAWNNEIHVNTKDPSIEEDWNHHGIYNDPTEMILNLTSGTNFLRSRHHGPNGPGPWSNVVSITIT